MATKSKPKSKYTGKGWAITSWTVADAQQLAEEKGISLDKDQAISFMNEAECDLEERMIRAGWDFLEMALEDWAKERGLLNA